MDKNIKVGKKIPRSISGTDYIALVTLAFAAAIVPLLVRMRVINLKGVRFDYWVSSGHTIYDFFSSIKSLFLTVCLFVLVAYLLIKFIQKAEMRFSNIFIPVIVYTVMVIISTIFSKYFDVSLYGFTDRWEGALVLVCYSMLAYISFCVLREGSHVIKFFIILLASCFIIALIGLTQFYGADFLQTFEGKRLMLPKEYEYMALGDAIRFNFAGQKVMYTTLYNPNYVGSYSVLLLPISIALYYFTLGKQLWKSFCALILFIGSFVLWLGGMSRAGLLGGIAVFIILAVLLRKRIGYNKRMSIALLAVMVTTYLIIDISSGGLVSKEFINTLPSSVQSIFVKNIPESTATPSAEKASEPDTNKTTQSSTGNSAEQSNNNTRQYVQKVELKNNLFTIVTDTETLNLNTSGDQLEVFEPSGNSMILAERGTPITLTRNGQTIDISDGNKSSTVTLAPDASIKLSYKKNVIHATDEKNNIITVRQDSIDYNLKIVDNTLCVVDVNNNIIPLLDKDGKLTFEPDANIAKMYDSQNREFLSVTNNQSYLFNITNNTLGVYDINGKNITNVQDIETINIIYSVNVLNVSDQFGSKVPLFSDTQKLTLIHTSNGLAAVDQNQKEIPVIKADEVSKAVSVNNVFEIQDSKGNAQVTLSSPINKTFDDPRYNLYSIALSKDQIYLHYAEIVIPLFFNQDKLKLAANAYLTYDYVDGVPKVGFNRQERFGSGRGFLWSRSIPLIKDTILIGHGPDTYPMYFPQQDIAGKIDGLDVATAIVDKPHNWYLQIAINTGLISLIAILVLLGWFAVKGIRKWFIDKGDPDHLIGVATLVAVIGYCIAAFFNDSNVSVAPVFWIILGIGIAFLNKNKVEVPNKNNK